MAVSLHEIYKRLQEKKRRRRDMNTMIKDQLAAHARYQEILEEIAKLREEKKSLEKEMWAPADLNELEALKVDIKDDQEMLADVALNMYIANEPVEIVDEVNARWVPVFAVRFKKD